MRIAVVLLLSACATAAHAEKLYSPVYVKQTTAACGDLASLKVRDGLIQQNRTETLSGINTMSALTGECGNAPEGQWMFFDQASGEYVCLRPRLGADCAWIRKAAVGEIVELSVPTRKPDCHAMAAAIDKSRKFEDELSARHKAERPANMAEDFARGVMGDMLGMVTGVNGNRVDRAKICLYYFVSAQEEARRLLAYQACPALGAGKTEQERQGYSVTMRVVNETCTPH